MELSLYNTLTRTKQPFRPLDPMNVRMYVCGPTVYDFAHIGNARPVIVFDVLYRLLRQLAKQGVWDDGRGETKVTYVRNITDVDDKINQRAAEDFPIENRNDAIRRLTERTARRFQKDTEALGCLRPTAQPRATKHIPQMRELIERLLHAKFAYVEKDHVLFSPEAMNATDGELPRYGALGNKSLEEMIAGARVDVAPYKHNPMDFVLWKPSKPDEPSWPSPGGIAVQGRPGWHIECSAMADKALWEDQRGTLSSEGLRHPHQFDIHGGGIDLVFPHHENEVAQTCCAFHVERMAQVWMHNGFLQVDGEKMSKSLGNFFTIRDLLETEQFGGREWDGEVLRFAMLQTHYRQPIDWTVRLLEQSESRLNKWRDFTAERVESRLNRPLFETIMRSVCDDLSLPAAFAAIDEAVGSAAPDDKDRHTVNRVLGILGFQRNKSHVSKLASNLRFAARNVSHLTVNDWRNLADSVRRRPNLASGKVRPGTEVIAALTALEELFKQIRPLVEPAVQSPAVSQLRSQYSETLALKEDSFDRKISELIQKRKDARLARDFIESDRIRDELAKLGVVVKDGKDASGNPVTTWEVAR